MDVCKRIERFEVCVTHVRKKSCKFLITSSHIEQKLYDNGRRTKRIPTSDRDTTAHTSLPLLPACGRHEIIINTRLTEWYCALNWFVSVEATEQWARTPHPMANKGKKGGHGREEGASVGRTWERPPTQWRPSWRSDLRPPGCAPPASRIHIRIRCLDCVLMPRAMSTTAALRRAAPISNPLLSISLLSRPPTDRQYHRTSLNTYRCPRK